MKRTVTKIASYRQAFHSRLHPLLLKMPRLLTMSRRSRDSQLLILIKTSAFEHPFENFKKIYDYPSFSTFTESKLLHYLLMILSSKSRASFQEQRDPFTISLRLSFSIISRESLSIFMRFECHVSSLTRLLNCRSKPSLL